MKKLELRQIIREEITSMQTLSDMDTLKALMDMWEKIPLGVRMNQGGMTRVIAREIREKLNKMGYKIVKV
jgi:hypothetical protein